MERVTIERINRLNERFYRDNHASFDRTRQTPWPGWSRLIDLIAPRGDSIALTNPAGPFRLLDIACGNMRFEKYLVEAAQNIELQALCVDSCDELATDLAGCTYVHADIVDALINGEVLADAWGNRFDAVVSFGFFHHVPGAAQRACLLDALIDAVVPGGFVALSLWRFASDEKRRAKAERTTAEAIAALSIQGALEDGDYLLGWNDVPGVYRYCHSFDDAEIEALVSGVAARATLVDRFRADGSTNALNEYLVFRTQPDVLQMPVMPQGHMSRLEE